MEYRSPLGCNFKLQQSLSLSREDSPKPKDLPKGNEIFNLDNSGQSYFDSNTRRNSSGRNYSPAWQGHSNNWRSPNQRNSRQNEPVPVEQLYHPSMLENPWAELEDN